MADLNETVASKIDLTIADFRTSGCAWCHPGGGVTEYDREGYRFDGKPGLFNTGANPNPKTADYKIAGLVATTTDASTYCKDQTCAATVGAGYVAVTATSATLNNPEDTINQGTLISAWDPVAGAWKTVGKKYVATATAGSGEADCLMCHLSYQYANLERNYAFNGATMPKLGASLGLVGAGAGNVGLLNITAEGASGANPNVAPTGWSWNTTWGSTTNPPGASVMLRPVDIQKTPRNENCALCHFPDKSMAGTAAVTGPAGKPLGYTSFQKTMPAGSMRDGDELPGVNGKDGNNDAVWNIAKGRVEGGKRGESINDANNRDAHMKWPGYTGSGRAMKCVECHYNLEGTYAAVTDTKGTSDPADDVVVQPTVTVGRDDHMFAKGDNTPDGKNMDQLDNTATCESCHTTRTHLAAGNAPNPATAHASFPPVHFERLACKVCHIPSLNAAMNQDLADFTVGPYRTFERTQTTEAAGGTNRKPLYMWRQTEHGQGEWQIQPFEIMAVSVIANATAANGDGEATAVTPTFQRLGKRAAELMRAARGDANADGVYDWPLNQPHGPLATDQSLLVNTPAEITEFVGHIATAGGAAAPPNPVIHFYFNQFALSHNVIPKGGNPANGKYILGSPSGGGCVMCHSDGAGAGSVGFFDRSFQLFAQPTDGGGLVQTVLTAAAPLSGGLERVSVKFPYSNPLASGTTLPASFAPAAALTSVNLSNGDGQVVGNTVNQGTLLGYGPEQLALLRNPDLASFTITASVVGSGTITDGGVSAVGARRVPGLTSRTYTITPNAGNRIGRVWVNNVEVLPVTSTGMTYTFTAVAKDQTISATFAADASLALSVRTGGSAQGTLATTGTDPDISCTANVGTCSGLAPPGSTVTLTATPANGAMIKSWFGCPSLSADWLTCTIAMTAARSVTATFEPATYLLTVRTAGTGAGTVTAANPTISCSANAGTCSGDAANGGTVTLTAAAAGGSIVTGWSGCTTVSADKLTCTALMTAARTVTATFAPATYLLSVQTAGAGQGTVTGANPTISCANNAGTCSGDAANGGTVTLTAAPEGGSIVTGWSSCTSVSADKLTCTVKMTSARTVAATFAPATYLLTVQTAGGGQGTVTAVTPPITCSNNAGTCSGTVANGATVTLSAAPASGSVVSSWLGCSGGVSADFLTCKTTMTSAKTVTATFGVQVVTP